MTAAPDLVRPCRDRKFHALPCVGRDGACNGIQIWERRRPAPWEQGRRYAEMPHCPYVLYCRAWWRAERREP